VANYLGFTVVVAPVAALLSMAVWGAVFLLFKTPFLSSFAMVAVLTAGVGGAYHQTVTALAGAVVTAGVVVWNHRQNMMDRWGAKKIG
jgi:glycerol-3-phosphate acyltransferase PlsY